MLTTLGSAVRASARISARTPPLSGIANGTVPRRSPRHSMTAAPTLALPGGRSVKRARPAASLRARLTSISLVLSTMPRLTG